MGNQQLPMSPDDIYPKIIAIFEQYAADSTTDYSACYRVDWERFLSHTER